MGDLQLSVVVPAPFPLACFLLPVLCSFLLPLPLPLSISDRSTLVPCPRSTNELSPASLHAFHSIPTPTRNPMTLTLPLTTLDDL
ncbi:hypothetical protein R3P38DRAFT_1277374 [Favolaschia claudopus]|uniref:Secreted protein n=1 Tax=Favolaschia claudopus TaxID=2862362 RepID=A0AAW0B0F8_9AGAR